MSHLPVLIIEPRLTGPQVYAGAAGVDGRHAPEVALGSRRRWWPDVLSQHCEAEATYVKCEHAEGRLRSAHRAQHSSMDVACACVWPSVLR